ncbi:DUF4371 domain-containing protein [Trichonephila clavipes]|nr:DUF4371 domain-containing protein [Trichonephila clavipes]
MYENEGIKCFRCEVLGHKASECPDNNDTKLDVAHLIINKKETLNKKVLIGGLVLDALIDNGSRVTLMRKSVYDKTSWGIPVLRTVATLSVLPINLSPDDIEINIAPDIPHIYGLKNKTITPNFKPVKKDGLHVKDDQRTVTVSPVVKVPVELQQPSDLPKLEDDLKRLEKPGPMIQCVTEEPDEYIVSDTEEFLFENCLKDVKEDKACIPLKKTDPVVVVPESVSKEVNEKRRPRIKENKDYYFFPKCRQKIENSVTYCDHGVLVNPKRRKKDVPLKTCHIDHLGPHRITEIEEGIMEQTCRLEDQPIPGWPCGADRYFQATPIILLLMLTNALSVLGVCHLLDARRGESRRNNNVIDNSIRVEASGLLSCDKQFKFVCCIVILNYINPISKLLQTEDYDLPSAMEHLKNRKDFSKDLRSDTALNEMLCDAREFADEIDIPSNFELTQPRH